MCHHVFLDDGWGKNTNSQTNGLIKYISNTRGGVMQNESIATRMINIYFRVRVRIFNK